ncbi:MAG: SpoIIE family protein phosphatase [Clostridia bacterium]|nr:SpoIIE family protein phosphatase [Clostridia bacterium]
MKTNRLFADIGFLSLTHSGEQLCGDHVEIAQNSTDQSTVIALADGLGSGVKANILSILTSKLVSTIVASDLSISEAVDAIVQTLPVSSTYGVAYSTFSVVDVKPDGKVYIIEYDNPELLLIRDGKKVALDFEERQIGGKTLRFATCQAQIGDVFLMMSDGVTHAGVGTYFDMGWQIDKIVDFIAPFCQVRYSAKMLARVLLSEVNRLYKANPKDDATVCAMRIGQRHQTNLMLGPPYNKDDEYKMMSSFFREEGKHIVCGGTTSTIVADFLKKPLVPTLDYFDKDIPPIAHIEGVDLVTEGVITVNRVLEYAKNHLESYDSYKRWSSNQDGASKIARMLFEEATDINFYVGRAINSAHQNPNLPITFNIKMHLIEQLSKYLEAMGKKVKIHYY